MLHLPSHPLLPSKVQSYADLVDRYLLEPEHTGIISREQQLTFLARLGEDIINEQFYVITDIKTGSITHCKGVDKWLGITELTLSSEKFVHLINDRHRMVKALHVIVLFELLATTGGTPSFFSPVFTGTIALRHKSGTYIYCKQLFYPFQVTGNGKITEYLTLFIIVKEFAGEPPVARWLPAAEKPLDADEQLKKLLRKKFEELSIFSTQELRIIKKYLTHGDFTAEKIAQTFRIKKGTVDTFNKRILRKAETLFGHKFLNAKQAADYLHNAEIVR